MHVTNSIDVCLAIIFPSHRVFCSFSLLVWRNRGPVHMVSLFLVHWAITILHHAENEPTRADLYHPRLHCLYLQWRWDEAESRSIRTPSLHSQGIQPAFGVILSKVIGVSVDVFQWSKYQTHLFNRSSQNVMKKNKSREYWCTSFCLLVLVSWC